MNRHIFDVGDKSDPHQIGGKAAALGKLVSMGYDVPRFRVLSSDLFDEKGLQQEARDQLPELLEQIGPGPYAVRSSAREEDGAQHSHAGQFLSLLDVPAKEVIAASEKVWRSGHTKSVEDYRQLRGVELAGKDGAPAVIIQQMVAARVAGVAFSADPVSGRRDQIVISCVLGLAEALVGGEVTGSDFLVDATTKKLIEIQGDQILTKDEINLLVETCKQLEKNFKAPQDIEWAFDDEGLKLLQSRPITSKLRDAPHADEHVTIFDNSNIVESYPGLVTPLTYSFAQYAYARVYRMFVAIVGVKEGVIRENAQLFDNMLAPIDGRVYYNLINWYRALALLPGFSINRAHMETMMGVGDPLPDEIADKIAPRNLKGLPLLLEWMRVGKMAAKLAFEALRLSRTKADFEKRLNLALCYPASDLQRLSLSELAEEYRRIEADLLDRWDAPLINDFLCMIGFGASRKLLEKWGGESGLQLHNDIMIGQGDIISAEPARWITRMGKIAADDEPLQELLAAGDQAALAINPELTREITAYIEKFGDRCTQELKLESLPLDDDPTSLFIAISAAAKSTVKPSRAKTSNEGLQTLFKGRPVKRFVAGALVRWAKARVRDRENLRFERTRIFGRARRLFLAVGEQFYAHGKLEDPRDIFFLTVEEVLGSIEGFGVTRQLQALVDLRKSERKQNESRPDPAERLTVKGAVVSGLSSASSFVPERQDSATERRGTGCSKGVITARARVIHDPRTEHLQQGDILVARHTDPGWIAHFTNASAIVAERGSLLSHSAIVARELGIPCVVGLGGAMDWIEDGKRIEVDGASGMVRKIND